MRNARATREQNHCAKPANDRNGVRPSQAQNHVAAGHRPRSGGSSGARIAAGAAARINRKYATMNANSIAEKALRGRSTEKRLPSMPCRGMIRYVVNGK